MAYKFDRLQHGITRRQDELKKTAGILAGLGHRLSTRSSVAKVVLIILGAFSATKAVSDQLFGTSSRGSLVLYSAIGLLIAAVAGLEAAFKWDKRSADLTALAAECHSHMREVDSVYRKTVATASTPADATAAARALLDLQDLKLQAIQSGTAKLGVNITLDIYRASEEENPYPA